MNLNKVKINNIYRTMLFSHKVNVLKSCLCLKSRHAYLCLNRILRLVFQLMPSGEA